MLKKRKVREAGKKQVCVFALIYNSLFLPITILYMFALILGTCYLNVHLLDVELLVLFLYFLNYLCEQ